MNPSEEVKKEDSKEVVIAPKEYIKEVKPEPVVMNVTALQKIKGKYLVLPCKKSWLYQQNPQHDGSTIFSKAEIWIPADRSKDNADMITTGLSKVEEVEFENEMHLQPGTLSAYNKEYWSKITNIIKVPKEGLQLDCDNNIKHKLWLKVLLASSKVAKSKEDAAFNGLAEVMITSEEVEAKIDTEKFMVKAKAYNKFSQLSQSDKINFLKVFSEGRYKVSTTTKPDLIDQTIGTIVDSTPSEFLATFDNVFYRDYILLEDLLTSNQIVKKSGRFFVNGGVEIGTTKAQVVTNLASDEFQELKIGLIARLKK